EALLDGAEQVLELDADTLEGELLRAADLVVLLEALANRAQARFERGERLARLLEADARLLEGLVGRARRDGRLGAGFAREDDGGGGLAVVGGRFGELLLQGVAAGAELDERGLDAGRCFAGGTGLLLDLGEADAPLGDERALRDDAFTPAAGGFLRP